MEPKIRFKGFEGEWKARQIGELCDVLTGFPFEGSKILPKGKELLMRGINITEGIIRHNDDIDRYYDEDASSLSKYRLKKNDLVIGMDGSKVGKNSALVTDREENSLLVQRVARLRNDNAHIIRLIQIAIGSSSFFKYVDGMKTSSAIPHISPSDIKHFALSVSNDQEEIKSVASYFQHLDTLIQSTTKKIESLKQVKAASLQAMFPQEGGTTPRVRFKGFEGEWEKVKFAAFAEINRGLTYTPINIVENGVRVLRSSNIDNDVFVISNEDVFVTPNCINICYAKEGDILITAANGSPRLVGKHAIIRNTGSIPVVAGGFMYLVTSQESEFLNASMSSDWYWRFLKIGVAGGNGSIGNLNRNDLEETVFPIPSLKEERNMIASYFTSLDSQITLHSQRLEKLKQIKSACLDNMFV